MGLAAANTAQRVGIVALTPPLLILILCCSIASCIAPRSSAVILSNSSTAHRPKSARTNAPASNEKRPSLNASLTAAAVNPAALVPPPVVNLPRGEIRPMNDKICDLATPGSPSSKMWMSPRVRVPSPYFLATPPSSWNTRDFLIQFIFSSPTIIEGAMERMNNSTKSSRCEIFSISAISVGEISISSSGIFFLSLECIEM